MKHNRKFHVKHTMKQIDKKGKKNKTGALGEQIAEKYLQKHGFTILARNYLKKWGEIDLVVRGTSTVRFVEVKTVSYETRNDLRMAISRETWRPEENVHFGKIRRMNRAIESWLIDNNYSGQWEIDIVAVRIVPSEKYATVKYISNIVLE